MTDREVSRGLGIGNSLRYAATTGTVAIRWEGARAPTVWTVVAADVDPADARRELARRYIHIFDPRRLTGSPAGQGSPGGRRVTDSRPSRHRCCRFDRHLATNGCSQKTSRRFAPARRSPRPRACFPAATPTFCSMEQSGSFSFRARISDSVFGRPACGQARSSSKARSAEPGDGRTTPYGSMPGHVFRAKRATRSRPRPTPCRFQASSDRSRWFGTHKASPGPAEETIGLRGLGLRGAEPRRSQPSPPLSAAQPRPVADPATRLPAPGHLRPVCRA